jgi:hypothetical protein
MQAPPFSSSPSGPPMLVQDGRRQTRGQMQAAPPPPPVSSDTSPTLAHVGYQSQVGLPVAPAPASNTKLIIALAGIVAFLIVGVLGVVLLKPAPTGLLMVVVPDEVAATATLNINGKPVVNEQGQPIREWPYIQQVPVGSVTVMVKAPGYEPLVETVTVVEGNVPAQLKNELKKKSTGGQKD